MRSLLSTFKVWRSDKLTRSRRNVIGVKPIHHAAVEMQTDGPRPILGDTRDAVVGRNIDEYKIIDSGSQLDAKYNKFKSNLQEICDEIDCNKNN